MVESSCLCGAIAWSIDGEFAMTHCHCSMCRKLHGSAFASFIRCKASGFRWLRGDEKAAAYESSPGAPRRYCPVCGSVVPTVTPGAESVFVPAGNLDGDPGVRPAAHIFVGSKAPWYEIADDLTQHEAYPPGVDFPGVERPERHAETAGAVGGSCLCGAVRFELTGELPPMIQCHCSRCRKARSAAHVTNLFVEAGQFRWLAGEDEATQFKLPEASFGTAFCRTCGSSVPRARAGAPRVMVPAGCLDDDPGSRPRLHIFVGSKAPWFEIADSLPQFEEGPRPRARAS